MCQHACLCSIHKNSKMEFYSTRFFTRFIIVFLVKKKINVPKCQKIFLFFDSDQQKFESEINFEKHLKLNNNTEQLK